MLATRQKIGIVVCPNLDGWHEHPFIEYVIWNHKILDDPDPQACLRIVKAYDGMRDVEIVERTCIYCQKRLPRR